MSWAYAVKRFLIRVLQALCTGLLRASHLRIPSHIGVIMDGNRRFARRSQLHLADGYMKGYEKLIHITKCCTLLRVRELTVYAFSIENFKRSAEEVSSLMRLAEDKLQAMMDELGDVQMWGIRIRVVGRLELLSPKLQALSARIALGTRQNDKLLLNLAVSYTGRDEISRAASAIVDGVRDAQLTADDVDEELVTRVLELSEPQLLVRTSGEGRLSDYMLWQISNTVLYFMDTLWPEFTIVHMFKAMLHYMRHAPASRPSRASGSLLRKTFLETLEANRMRKLERFAAYRFAA